MKLEQMTFVARPRKPWEAVDLGLRMARRWWAPLLLSWLALAIPAVFLLWLLPVPDSWIPWLVWWLKPLFERPQLFMLSRGVFGSLPGLSETLKMTPALLSPQWFSSLTWRRFSPSRSYDLPLVLLEELEGKDRRQRMMLLHRKQYSQAAWVTLIGYHLELLLTLSLVLFMAALMPQENIGQWIGQLLEHENILLLFYILAMAVVSPFYVAAGFSLYLNRRIHLEAWDIEISFRQLAARYVSPVVRGVVVLVLSCSLGLAFSVAPAMAVSHPEPGLSGPGVVPMAEPLIGRNGDSLTPDEARAEIERIVHSDELEETQTLTYPKFLLDWNASKDDSLSPQIPAWLSEIIRLVASGIEWLAWVLVAGLLVLVLVRYRSWLQLIRPARRSRTTEASRPETLFGLDVRADSLPAQLPEAVWKIWRQGNSREALSLLYRGTLSRLIHLHALDFPPGQTEADCLRIVQQEVKSPAGDYFAELTRVWQCLAYAHVLPDEAEIQRLCEDWAVLFAERARP